MEARLLTAVSGPRCMSYADVLSRLGAIESALSERDGLRWFNRLYTAMTRAVAEEAQRRGFADSTFLELLDCGFAELYFAALRARLERPGSEPRAWTPLFDARADARVSRLQLALAGVNAHINRDLCVALVSAFETAGAAPQRDTARHRDYLHVNRILAAVQTQAKQMLFSELLTSVDEQLGRADDVLELWSLDRARDAAWVAGELQWQLRSAPLLAAQHLDALDRLVGCAGRGLLRVL